MGFCLFKYWKRCSVHTNMLHTGTEIILCWTYHFPMWTLPQLIVALRKHDCSMLRLFFGLSFAVRWYCQFFHLWLITLSWIELTPLPLSKRECFVRITVAEVLFVVYVPRPMWSSMMLRDSWMDSGLWWANWICELVAMEGYILVAGEVEEWRSRKSWLGIPVVAGWEVTVFAWCGVVSCCMPFANFAGYLPVRQVCLILDLIIAMSNRRWKTFFVHVKVVLWCSW